ncbi:MAG: M48 family metallopeptidase [Acidiferrobacterales bacterium]
MNFFESQDRVRKNTVQLVFLFILAVGTLIIMTNLLVMMVFGYVNSEQLANGGTLIQQMDWQTFFAVSIGVGIVVLVGSLYKIMVLSAGGKAVAEALGGQLIPQNTQDINQRKLLNVVEEMAIASGTPAPPVYLLAGEQGINAFAAGFSPRDAVIGVTQGTIEHLSRDQLQGVIAHEFSHIFNGDMRLNIRLMGVLNGILIIGIIGYYILYSTAVSRRGRSSDKGGGGIMALAIGLMVIGFAGTFFGGLIKAAVSRQREYLADASAVQFTRNPDGIAGALKRIGGLEIGSVVENPGAPEVSHAFFAQGISGFVQSLSATHPPLAKRIRAIDPHWDGKFDTTGPATSHQEPEKKSTQTETAKKTAAIIAGAAVMTAIDQIGSPKQEAINYARSLLSEMPTVIKDAAREPYGARAIIYSLVLDTGEKVRAKQLQQLQDHADPDVYVLTLTLMQEMDGLDVKFRLPLIDIAIPALKQLSLDQYKAFRGNLIALIQMDSRVDLLEWSLQKILFNHLDGQFFKLTHVQPRYSRPRQVKKEIEMILSVMAYAGHRQQAEVENAFHAATATLKLDGLVLLTKNDISLAGLDQSLEKLTKLKQLLKPRILKACAASIVHDGQVLAVEVELLRAFSDVLDCPMPPVI